MAFEEKESSLLVVYRRTIPYGCCQNLSVEVMDLFDKLVTDRLRLIVVNGRLDSKCVGRIWAHNLRL